ncbi:MAG: glycosyltransferase family 9 protein, partial [Opitutales bacterium]|nr:glycosyltransferase family 9 protein [Opitutales bacterium]
HSQNKIGVADGREFSTFLYKSIGESSRKTEIHAIDRLVPFLNHLGVDNWNRELPIAFPLSQISPSTHQHTGEKDFILLFPESRRQEKVWPHFLKLSHLLTKNSRLSIVVAGNNRDELYPGTIDLRGRINLAELPALIDRASVIVSNDSAPLHIASSLKKPLVTLFGPTSAKRYGPYPQNSEQNIILTAQEKNLETITVEQVAFAIEQFLSE